MMRDARQKRRFEREAKAAAKLHHTNIVPVFGTGEHTGTPCYVMQFIQGLGLDAVVEEVARMTPGGPSAEQAGERERKEREQAQRAEREARESNQRRRRPSPGRKRRTPRPGRRSTTT
jgi:hypothetical protein